MTKKNPLSDKAHEMYDHGMKLVDIAAELGVPQGTIRRWKSTQNWNKKGQDSASERSGKKSERSHKKKEQFNVAADYPQKSSFFVCIITVHTMQHKAI